MRWLVLAASIAAFVLIAGLTVHLQVRAVLRSYEIGREEGELEWLRQEVQRSRTRVEEIYRTPLVHQRALEFRELRQQEVPLLAL